MDLEHANGELFDALAKFRTQVVQPVKSVDNPFFKKKYVDLDGVVKSVDKGCDGIGLGWFQEVRAGENIVEVKTVITHSDGGYLVLGPVSMPVGGKKDAQAVGSATTYAKRYALAAAFGISSDVDDDANSNQPASAPKKRSQPNKSTASSQAAKAKNDITTQLRTNLQKALVEYCKLNNTATNEAYKSAEIEMLTQNGATNLETATNEQLSDTIATVKAINAAIKDAQPKKTVDNDGNPI